MFYLFDYDLCIKCIPNFNYSITYYTQTSMLVILMFCLQNFFSQFSFNRSFDFFSVDVLFSISVLVYNLNHRWKFINLKMNLNVSKFIN